MPFTTHVNKASNVYGVINYWYVNGFPPSTLSFRLHVNRKYKYMHLKGILIAFETY